MEQLYSGHCHCGAVTLTITRKPEVVVDCDCSWCSKTGARWGYFTPEELVVTGTTRTYANRDRNPPYVALHFCGECGCVTHWTGLPILEEERVGANMRMFGNNAVSGVELRFYDGKNWNGSKPPDVRCESIILP